MNKIAIFIIIQIAMICFAYSEAILEGAEGWAHNRKVWRFKIHQRYDYTSYHLVTYYLLFPIIIILLPLAIAGFSWSLFWLLLASYLIGTILEDFFWFIFNPERPFAKWNPEDTTWYPWIKIGKFHTPAAYVVKFIIGVVILTYLV